MPRTPDSHSGARALLAAATTLAAAAAAAAEPTAPPAFAASNLTPPGVRAMASGCATCHGTDGHPAPGSILPPLAGSPRDEMIRVMGLFKEGKRPSTVMQQIARGFTDAEIVALAGYFSKMPRGAR